MAGPVDGSEQPLLSEHADDSISVDGTKTSQTSLDKLRAWARLIACCISAAAAGWHDGCLGALIPYLEVYYGGLSDQSISFVFIGTVTGFILASLLNVTLNTRLGLGRLFMLGAVFQAAASAIIACRPPFFGIALSYTLAGFGLSLQDAQFNTYITRLPNASTNLGIVHGIYGAGAMVSPAIATLLMHTKIAPHFFYLTTLAWCLATLTALTVGFGLGGASSAEDKAISNEEIYEDNAPLTTVIKSRPVWSALLFIILYVGAETTEAGWVVSFLMRARNGGTKSGYASAAYYGGLTSSRVVLLPLTAWLTERRAIAVYAVTGLALQVVIWAVPSFLVDFIAIAGVGFVMGPIYPVTLYIVTKATPHGYHPGAISLLACFGQVGSAIFPFVVGSLADIYGIRVLQPVLVALFGAMILVWQLVPSGRGGEGSGRRRTLLNHFPQLDVHYE